MAYAAKLNVAPVRERGLKYIAVGGYEALAKVAPVRERGLKCHHQSLRSEHLQRSLP